MDKHTTPHAQAVSKLLKDPDVSAAGFDEQHIHAIQEITNAIGGHEHVYDALVKKFGATPPKAGDLQSRILQAFNLMQSKPGFSEEFAKEMDKHYTVTPFKHK